MMHKILKHGYCCVKSECYQILKVYSRHLVTTPTKKGNARLLKYKQQNSLENGRAIELLVDVVTGDSTAYDGIVEWYPGYGKVTEAMMSKMKNRFVLFEPNEKCNNYINDLVQCHSDHRITVSDLDPCSISAVIKPDSLRSFNFPRKLKLQSSIISDHFRGLQIVRVVAPVLSTRIFHKLTRDFGLGQNSNYGRFQPIFYFYISTQQYKQFVEKRLFEFYYTIETKAVISFIPTKISTNNIQEYKLIKVIPRTSLLAEFDEEDFVKFYYFARSLLYKRSEQSVIEWLDSYIPGSGRYFIQKGLKTFIKAPKLTNDKFLEVYRHFTSHPSFKNCAFSQAVKMEIFGHMYDEQP